MRPHRPSGRMAFVGSSIGWMATLVSLMFPIMVEGYESVPQRLAAATEIATKHSVWPFTLPEYSQDVSVQVDVKFFLNTGANITVDFLSTDVIYFSGLHATWIGTERVPHTMF